MSTRSEIRDGRVFQVTVLEDDPAITDERDGSFRYRKRRGRKKIRGRRKQRRKPK